LGVGAAGGGIVGGLVGAGIAEKRAKDYEKGLREGGVLVAVRPKSPEHREKVRRALADDRMTRGELEPNTDYAGEVRP
jgi:hypothetical protein